MKLLAGLIAAQAAFGQATPPPAVRFTVFAAKPISDVSYAPRPTAARVNLAFQPTARSARYDYRGTMPVRFFDPDSGAVVAEANIPAGIRDALLLFSPIEGVVNAGDKNGAALRYQIAVLDDAATRHGPGGLAILNLSGLALSGTVNKEKVTLKAGLNSTLAVGASAKVALSTTFKNRIYQAYAGTAALKRNERALLILFPPFYKGSLEVQSRVLIDQPPGMPTAVAPPILKR